MKAYSAFFNDIYWFPEKTHIYLLSKLKGSKNTKILPVSAYVP